VGIGEPVDFHIIRVATVMSHNRAFSLFKVCIEDLQAGVSDEHAAETVAYLLDVSAGPSGGLRCRPASCFSRSHIGGVTVTAIRVNTSTRIANLLVGLLILDTEISSRGNSGVLLGIFTTYPL
jgi:hypothetical protein